jgi:hypothetical protein
MGSSDERAWSYCTGATRTNDVELLYMGNSNERRGAAPMHGGVGRASDIMDNFV